ncbi:MAG: hypothetical protein LQ342_002300 [Letrouitia transgressa]|nr:MAG: hypothetical protein LQ342_002300 [Letrouitia transgressa]
MGRKRDLRLRRVLRERAKLAKQQATPKAIKTSQNSPGPENSVRPIATPLPPETPVPHIAAPPLSLNEEENNPTTSEREKSQHPSVEELVKGDVSPSKRKRVMSASDQTEREKIPRREIHFQAQKEMMGPSASSGENTNPSSGSTEFQNIQPLSIENPEGQEDINEKAVAIGNSATPEVQWFATLPIHSKSMDIGCKDIASTSIAQRAAGRTEPVREISQGSLPRSTQVPNLAEETSAAKGTQPSPPLPIQRSRDVRHLRNQLFFEALQQIGKAMARKTSQNKMLQKPPPGLRPPGLRVKENMDEMDISEPLARDRENEDEEKALLAAMRHELLAEDFCACVGSLSIEDSSDSKSSSQSGKQPVGMLDDKDFEPMMNELDTALGEFLEEESSNQLENQPQDKPKSKPEEEIPAD